MREIIKEGRTVDEAIELACNELGVGRDLIDFEIINLPKRGFLGFRNTPAKVRVTVNLPEAEEKPPVPKPKPAPEKTQPQRSEPVARNREVPKKTAPKAMTPPKTKTPKPEVKNAELQHPDYDFIPAEEVTGKAKKAADYVDEILRTVGVQAKITVAQTEPGIIIRLSGDGLGVIIGRRGETLDSLQYLAGLVANRESGDYMRVTIDSGNYREKRERTLEKLAQKLSSTAMRNGRKVTLEPMNPYERRIIHSTVSKIEGVSSSSVGDEPNRKVVITPANLKPRSGASRQGRPPRNGNNGGKKRYNDGPRSNFQNREQTKPVPRESAGKVTSLDVDQEYARELNEINRQRVQPEKPVEAKPEPVVRKQLETEGDNLPLYGKIEL